MIEDLSYSNYSSSSDRTYRYVNDEMAMTYLALLSIALVVMLLLRRFF